MDFQTALGSRLVALGHITPGHPINVDGHTMKTYFNGPLRMLLNKRRNGTYVALMTRRAT